MTPKQQIRSLRSDARVHLDYASRCSRDAAEAIGRGNLVDYADHMAAHATRIAHAGSLYARAEAIQRELNQ